jgi:hypothetical protein
MQMGSERVREEGALCGEFLRVCIYMLLPWPCSYSLFIFLSLTSHLCSFTSVLVFSSSRFLIDCFASFLICSSEQILIFFSFGAKAIDNFLENNQLSYIIRAHEAHAHGVSLSKGARFVV